MPHLHFRSATLLALLLVAVLATPAAAEAPTAASVVERYLQATGGRAAFEADSTLHVLGRISSGGMTGRYEAWLRRPDCMATRISLGTLRARSGCRGSTAWRSDLTAKRVTMLDGKDLEEARAEAWFENGQWALAAGGGTIALGSVSYAGRHQRQALEITPPAGRGWTLWFDVKTGLLDRVRHDEDNDQWQKWLAGYRVCAGRRRAMVEQAGDPDVYDAREGITIDSVWVGVPLPDSLFDPPPPTGGAVTWLKTRGVAHLPFRYGSRAIWVRASINGAPPADFLLDTGCSASAIDDGYAASIGLATEGSTVVQGIGALARASYATVQRLRLAGPDGDGVVVRDLKVSVVDLVDDMETGPGRRPVGLIGYDFLSRFVTEIDYDRGVLTFHDPAGFAYEGTGTALPMGLTHGVPTIELTLNGTCGGTFLVDTGNSTELAIHGSMVRRCDLGRIRRKEIALHAGGIGGSFPEWLGRLDSLRIGPFGWKEPLAGLSLHNQGGVGSQDYSGNVGNSVLERFRCTFDYGRRRLVLEPGARYDRRDSYSRLGATLVRAGERVLAVGIVSDSPADSAGLQWLDQVKSVDGRPILRFTPDELDRLFVDEPEGSVHHITITRRLKDVDLEVVLREVI